MMIMITPQDFRRLSAACQRELLALLSPVDAEQPPREDEMSMPPMEPDQYGATDDYHFSPLPPEDAGVAQPTFVADVADAGTKRVIDITLEQARELIANVSERSQDALKRFAAGPAVPLAALVGPAAPYRDFNDLKRSLVGAVNRRLRTVTENRAAVLFSSDRDKTRIRITPPSAAALRQALQMPEPLPELAFFDRAGKAVVASAESAIAFQKHVEAVWTELSLRPLPGQISLMPAQVLRHLADHGFALIAVQPETMAEDTAEPALDADRPMADGTAAATAFLAHPACPEVVATLAVLLAG